MNELPVVNEVRVPNGAEMVAEAVAADPTVLKAYYRLLATQARCNAMVGVSIAALLVVFVVLMVKL